MVYNNSNITNASQFPFVENSQLRAMNQSLQDKLTEALELIDKLKAMPLDMIALWQADIEPDRR